MISTRMKNLHHLLTHDIKAERLTKDWILQAPYVLEIAELACQTFENHLGKYQIGGTGER